MTDKDIHQELKILIVEDQQILDCVYSLNLRIFLGLEVISKKNAEFCKKVLEGTPNIALILTKSKIGEEDTAFKIFEIVKKKVKNIPMVVIGQVNDISLKQSSVYIKDVFDIPTLVKRCATAIKVTPKTTYDYLPGKYTLIPVLIFLNISYSVCDVFIEDIESKDPISYIKILKANEKFNEQKIKDLISSGICGFYVSSADQMSFANEATKEILSKICPSKQ